MKKASTRISIACSTKKALRCEGVELEVICERLLGEEGMNIEHPTLNIEVEEEESLNREWTRRNANGKKYWRILVIEPDEEPASSL